MVLGERPPRRACGVAAHARKVHAKPYVEMLAEAQPRSGFFEHRDFEKVCRHLPDEIEALARFCYVTGWRWKSEVRPLTWSQVDMRRKTLTLEAGTTKSGEPRVFVMTPGLHELLKTRQGATVALRKQTGKDCPLVFHRDGRPLNWFYDSWRDACEAAGVPGRLLHDLRRTAIRNLVRAGVSDTVAMKMCGHKTRAVFDRYNITSERDLRHAAARLSAHHRTLARRASTT